jgi:hypothetical protein
MRSLAAVLTISVFLLAGCATEPELEETVTPDASSVEETVPPDASSVEETAEQEQERKFCELWITFRRGDSVDVAQAEFDALAAAEFGSSPRSLDLVSLHARYVGDLRLYRDELSGRATGQDLSEVSQYVSTLLAALDAEVANRVSQADLPIGERFPVVDAENRNAAEEQLTEACLP